MAKFEPALEKVLGFEGRVLENDPSDPGGQTYSGIDRRDNSSWNGWAIIDANKGKKSSELLKIEELQKCVFDYYKAKWDTILGDEINDQHLAEVIFDSLINPGPAVKKKVQQFVGVPADGSFGPKTIEAINNHDAQELITEIKQWRTDYYNSLPEKLKSRFLAGWLSRTNAC